MRRIDCYGNETTSAIFERHRRPEPLETKQVDGWTYMRFTDGANCVIHRLGVEDDGMVSETWAWGSWDEARTLSYGPLAETREVDA